MVEQDSESKADLLISQEDGECDEYMMCGSYCRLIYADAGHLLYTWLTPCHKKWLPFLKLHARKPLWAVLCIHIYSCCVPKILLSSTDSLLQWLLFWYLWYFNVSIYISYEYSVCTKVLFFLCSVSFCRSVHKSNQSWIWFSLIITWYVLVPCKGKVWLQMKLIKDFIEIYVHSIGTKYVFPNTYNVMCNFCMKIHLKF